MGGCGGPQKDVAVWGSRKDDGELSEKTSLVLMEFMERNEVFYYCVMTSYRNNKK